MNSFDYHTHDNIDRESVGLCLVLTIFVRTEVLIYVLNFWVGERNFLSIIILTHLDTKKSNFK